MPLMRSTDGAGGCYTIPTGLCYDCGFWALTLALALRSPGRLFTLLWGEVQESVSGFASHRLLTAPPPPVCEKA